MEDEIDSEEKCEDVDGLFGPSIGRMDDLFCSAGRLVARWCAISREYVAELGLIWTENCVKTKNSTPFSDRHYAKGYEHQ